MSRLLAILALAVVAITFGACLTTSEILVDRPWRLAAIDGVPAADADRTAGVSFGSDGRFRLDTGCNSGGGTYHLEGNRILLDQEELTAQACEGAVGVQEAAMLAVIEGEPSWSIDTGTGRLRLATRSGNVLLFETP